MKSKPKVIMLAAGRSRRFGSNKLLYRMHDGRPMILHALEPYLECGLDISCICHEKDKDLRHLLIEKNIDVITLSSSGFDNGMGDSIANGVLQKPSGSGWLIALADMPYLKRETLHALLPRYHNSIVRPRYGTNPGHPVYFPKRFREELTALKGEEGGRKLFKNEKLHLITVFDRGCIQDIDFPSDIL